jgi:lactoylglutathione lyase
VWTALHTATTPRPAAKFQPDYGSGMARLVGINHVALEVADLDEALAWYGQFFELELRGRIGSQMAFVDLGDQFIALARGRTLAPDADRHFGLVVDDKPAVRASLEDAGVAVTRAPNCSFRDPWGNHVQVVDYRDVQFTKAPEILRGMGLELEKTERAKAELREKGLS